jgi:hypothetical protein
VAHGVVSVIKGIFRVNWVVTFHNKAI